MEQPQEDPETKLYTRFELLEEFKNWIRVLEKEKPTPKKLENGNDPNNTNRQGRSPKSSN